MFVEILFMKFSNYSHMLGNIWWENSDGLPWNVSIVQCLRSLTQFLLFSQIHNILFYCQRMVVFMTVRLLLPLIRRWASWPHTKSPCRCRGPLGSGWKKREDVKGTSENMNRFAKNLKLQMFSNASQLKSQINQASKLDVQQLIFANLPSENAVFIHSKNRWSLSFKFMLRTHEQRYLIEKRRHQSYNRGACRSASSNCEVLLVTNVYFPFSTIVVG